MLYDELRPLPIFDGCSDEEVAQLQCGERARAAEPHDRTRWHAAAVRHRPADPRADPAAAALHRRFARYHPSRSRARGACSSRSTSAPAAPPPRGARPPPGTSRSTTASASTLTMTTCLPAAIAARACLMPTAGLPVASTTTSMAPPATARTPSSVKATSVTDAPGTASIRLNAVETRTCGAFLWARLSQQLRT